MMLQEKLLKIALKSALIRLSTYIIPALIRLNVKGRARSARRDEQSQK
jgi:hypothetical protein